MTSVSPEVIEGCHALSPSAVKELEREKLDPQLVILLARLNCLNCLTEHPEEFYTHFTSAVRAELMFSLSSGRFLKELGLWRSFSSFQKTVRAQTDDFSKDVLIGRYVFSQTDVRTLFDPQMNWSKLYLRSHNRLLNLLSEMNAHENLQQVLARLYKEQRDSLLKDVTLKMLPTIVLLISTLSAVVMAAFVWRSLFIGR